VYKELKKCKNFKEIYGIIGESGFSKGAELLMGILIFSPLLAGVVNFIMLTLLGNTGYDAYEYNLKYMTISNIIFAVITVYFLVYMICRISAADRNIVAFGSYIRKNEAWLIWWFFLLGWGLITCFTSVNPRGAIMGATELSSGYMSHIYMLCVMGCMWLTDSDGRNRLIKRYIIVSDILAVIMLAFQYNIPFLSRFTAWYGCSVFTNSNHYGYYIAVASLCMVGMFFKECENDSANQRIKSRYGYLGSFALQLWTLMINDTLGAYFGVVFGILALIIFWSISIGKVRLYMTVPALLVAFFTYLSFVGIITSRLGSTIGPSLVVFVKDIFKISHKQEGYEQAGTNRIKLWKDTIEAIKKSPVFGYGPDVMFDKNNIACVELTPHNEYLECALFMGIPGGVMYVGGLISLFISRVRRLKVISQEMLMASGAVVAYLVSAFFGVRKYHTVVYLFVFLGLLINKNETKEK